MTNAEQPKTANVTPIGKNKKDPDTTERFTSTWNARRFLGEYGDRVRFVKEWKKWIAWEGTRWVEDSAALGAMVREFAWNELDRAQQRLERLEGTGADTTRAEDRVRNAERLEEPGGVRDMLKMAETFEGVTISAVELDADAYLLNTPAGTFNLMEGRLQRHDPEDLITKITRGSYIRSKATRDRLMGESRWWSFLNEVQPDAAMRNYLRRVMGAGLVGRQLEETLPILVGDPNSGKTKFTEGCVHALGDYARAVSSRLITSADSSHSTEKMTLMGLRLATLSETGNRQSLPASLIKSLTGGDSITARRMRENDVTFRPSHQLLFLTNYWPEIDADDGGMWRRVKKVPFATQIPEDQWDKQLQETLEGEADIVLTWMILGWVAYQKSGYATGEPEQVKFATRAARENADTLGQFASDRLDFGDGQSCTPRTLLDSYTGWCGANSVEPLSADAFRRQFYAKFNVKVKVVKVDGRPVRKVLGVDVGPEVV